ncbi:MAG: mannose-6-phosphate isomerase [Bacillota bacterium]|nr:MAG: mannose-6-phosphate isomerase [Bacillota bacterium]MBS3950435.1 cupin domain-containing protein [Peptococcaceae bacterium]
MIRKAIEMIVDVHSEFLGGKGTLVNTHFLDKQNSAGTGRLFVKSTLSPGSSIGYHTHKGDLEVYYILSGKALVSDNGKESILEAGDSIYTPNGSSHSIENVGEVDLEYVALILFDRESV